MPEFHGTGRLPAPDPRDKSYPVRGAMIPHATPTAAPVKLRTRPWKVAASRDQGQTGTCVGHGWRHYLAASPETDKALRIGHTTPWYQHLVATLPRGAVQPLRLPTPWEIYRGAVGLDEFPANDGEAVYPDGDARLASGSSVRAGAKWLQQMGLLKEYRWAASMADVDLVLDSQTTIVVGTVWDSAMFEPSPEGVVKWGGRFDGGHCYHLVWRDNARGLYLFQQSWGWSWGIDNPYQSDLAHTRGFFWMAGEDVEKLLFRYDGEACIGVEAAR